MATSKKWVENHNSGGDRCLNLLEQECRTNSGIIAREAKWGSNCPHPELRDVGNLSENHHV